LQTAPSIGALGGNKKERRAREAGELDARATGGSYEQCSNGYSRQQPPGAVVSTSGASAIIDKVSKLLALASSPNENEARNAALKAAELIAAHHLQLAPKTAIRTLRPFAARGDGRRGEQVRPILITSRYAGICRACRRPYEIDDLIHWLRGHGAVHHGCSWEGVL